MPEAATVRGTLRAALKRAAEHAIAVSGVDWLALLVRRPGVTVLAYHNVVPHGERVLGDRSLHLSQEAFGRQLDALRRTHRVVALESAFDAPVDGRPRAVITFDDAYRGAATAGVDELARRGMPATFFVAPGLLGTVPWWDELTGADGLDPAVRAHALGVLGGRPALVREWAAAEKLLPRHALPAHHRVATAEELAHAAAQRGIRLAPHGWSHAALPACDPAELDDELGRPLAWLRERFAGVLPWLAYPYGLASAEVERAAEAAGYAGAFRVDGGALPRVGEAPRFSLPRLNVAAGVSDDGFRLRLAGFRRE